MQPKVSVVVPIYCVEKYLQQCVDSLLAQTLQDIEIILVDDGSPDRSGRIADDYAEKDVRIRVIHQSNAGLGPARNTGIRNATGEYVGFVDSDDWVAPEMFERLYETAVNIGADIVAGGQQEITDGIVEKTLVHPLAGTALDRVEDILRIRKNLYAYGTDNRQRVSFPVSACAAVYRRAMIEAENVQFENVLSEDRFFNLDAYRAAKKVVFVNYVDYCYRKDGQASITQTFSEKTMRKYRELFDLAYSKACGEEDRECVVRFQRMVIDCCRAYISMAGQSGASFRQKLDCIRSFLGNEAVRGLWQGYPMEALPFMQRVLHWTVVKEWYAAALMLNQIRRRKFFGRR